jgi:hypothetical protein
MFAAKRTLTADHLSRAFERFERLTPETARRVVQFHDRRMKLRAKAHAQDAKESAQTAPAKTPAAALPVAPAPLQPAV